MSLQHWRHVRSALRSSMGSIDPYLSHHPQNSFETSSLYLGPPVPWVLLKLCLKNIEHLHRVNLIH